jgi:hypothetical protein
MIRRRGRNTFCTLRYLQHLFLVCKRTPTSSRKTAVAFYLHQSKGDMIHAKAKCSDYAPSG